jgi:Protein of unknown function (DUF3768)
MCDSERAERIRNLNDALRRNPVLDLWVMSTGVRANGWLFVARAVRAVEAFNAFNEDNDPYGEHDFGAFEIEGTRLFWKIEYYQKGSNYSVGAETPEDPATTDRVLTIMLAEEY